MAARRLTILGLGSRGDLQPLLALGVGLKAAGHAVRFAAPADYEPFVRDQGLEFFRLTASSAAFFSGPAGIAMRERVRDATQFDRFFNDYLGTFLDKLLVSCFEATQGSDAVFCWSWTRAAPSLAQKLGVPLFVVGATPVLHLPTSEFANPFQVPDEPGHGPVANRASWELALPFTRVGQRQVDRWRERTLGLGPLPWSDELRMLQRLPHLMGYSPTLLPKPKDWAEWVHVTGYWFLDQQDEYAPPPHLRAFLDAGEAPVAIGFSSQASRDSRRITAAVIDALKLCGRRGLLIAGWGGLKGLELPDTICRIDSAPYDWLLPRTAAMVHHGGAGSTAAVTRVGVPSFAVPFGYEQAMWGARLAELGAGIAPLDPKDLTAESLAAAIHRLVENRSIRQRAAELAVTVRAERGVENAVAVIERTLAGRARRPAVAAAGGA